jgi:hypothetical protein
MDGPPRLSSTFEALLRRPGQVVHELSAGRTPVLLCLIVIAIVCLAVFGLLLGLFSGGMQLWAAPVKVVLGTLASILICLPSFYIFACLGGATIRLSTAVGLLLAMLALTGLLLVAFGPVLWLFTQGTDAIGFMGFLALAFWLLALLAGLRLIFCAAPHFGLTSRGSLIVWMGVFILVTLQMSTALRPIIGSSGHFWPTGKKFFLEHWVDSASKP